MTFHASVNWNCFLVGSEDTVTGPAWGKTSSENVHASLLLLSHFATSLILFSPRIFDAIKLKFCFELGARYAHFYRNRTALPTLMISFLFTTREAAWSNDAFVHWFKTFSFSWLFYHCHDDIVTDSVWMSYFLTFCQNFEFFIFLSFCTFSHHAAARVC